MNNKLPKFYLFALLFLSDFIAYAAPGDDLEPEPDAAPINSNLIILLFAGILFAIYTFRRNRKVGTEA